MLQLGATLSPSETAQDRHWDHDSEIRHHDQLSKVGAQGAQSSTILFVMIQMHRHFIKEMSLR
jgi:hypothetical protein